MFDISAAFTEEPGPEKMAKSWADLTEEAEIAHLQSFDCPVHNSQPRTLHMDFARLAQNASWQPTWEELREMARQMGVGNHQDKACECGAWTGIVADRFCIGCGGEFGKVATRESSMIVKERSRRAYVHWQGQSR